MKNFIVLFFFILVYIGHIYSQEATVSPDLVFDERVFDFGTINEKDGIVKHTFYFTNTSKTSVSLNSVVSGCGCTSHEFTQNPIKPGAKGKVIITYNPDYRPGTFSKEIVIFSNNGKNYNRVWIKGDVIPMQHPVEDEYPYSFGRGLHLNLKVLSFGRVPINQRKEIVLRYANETDQPMKLQFVVEGEDQNLNITQQQELKAKARGEMAVSYTTKKAIEEDKIIYVYLLVNGFKLAQPIEIKVSD